PATTPIIDKAVPTGIPNTRPPVTAMMVTGIGVRATSAYSTTKAATPHIPSPAISACRVPRSGRRTLKANHSIVTSVSTRAMLRRIEPQGVPSRSRVRRASRVSDGVVAGVGSVGSGIGLRIGRGEGRASLPWAARAGLTTSCAAPGSRRRDRVPRGGRWSPGGVPPGRRRRAPRQPVADPGPRADAGDDQLLGLEGPIRLGDRAGGDREIGGQLTGRGQSLIGADLMGASKACQQGDTKRTKRMERS